MLPLRSEILAGPISIHLSKTKTIFISRFVFATPAFAPVQISYSNM